MVKTQIQLPEQLYREAQRVAREREMSLADVVRRAVEHIASIVPRPPKRRKKWSLPPPRDLGTFLAPVEEWRMIANEPPWPPGTDE